MASDEVWQAYNQTASHFAPMLADFLTSHGLSTSDFPVHQADWVARHIWRAYETVGELPEVCPTGFLTTYVASLVMMPVILYVSLAMIWSLADVGPARKSMTTVFVVVLGVPVYPLLIAVVLMILWLILGVLGIACVTLGPIFLIASSWCSLLDMKNSFVQRQRERESVTEDISCMQLMLGLAMGILCFSTVGLCACIATLVKGPILLLSGFIQAWWHAGRAWLKLVECSWCYKKRNHELLSGEETGSDDKEGSDGSACTWWYWFPLVLAAWLVFVALGLCVALLIVILSALVKLVVAAIYPAYVTAGWLRHFGGSGGRRGNNSCSTALWQGLKAGYQVLWASDVLTNAFIRGDPWILDQTQREFLELARGERDELSPSCQRLSPLPPVVVGLFQDSWDFVARELAAKLGIAEDEVEEAWRSLTRQMIRIGRQAVDEGLLTKEWVAELPVELIIGLPARALLDTIERSPNEGELVLSSGLVLRDEDRPRSDFFDEVWDGLMRARAARFAVTLSQSERNYLCAALLAGGGEHDELPQRLAAAVQSFESLPEARRSACNDILLPLVALSLRCSRKKAFKDKLQLIVRGITSSDGAVVGANLL
eukprot:TRINITY_DN26681_c0_g1_i1.p1 TRINITY_DN26681_c0_g1~~TRINITY_DN26681_c0_g1_i1.p1  ORF type:complete len:600 (-),score=73.87 TRINITY_DN26681_c0_g1_i1:376-2175(-)